MESQIIKSKILSVGIIIFVFGFIGIACYLYFNVFSGDFSDKQADRGSFGSGASRGQPA